MLFNPIQENRISGSVLAGFSPQRAGGIFVLAMSRPTLTGHKDRRAKTHLSEKHHVFVKPPKTILKAIDAIDNLTPQ